MNKHIRTSMTSDEWLGLIRDVAIFAELNLKEHESIETEKNMRRLHDFLREDPYYDQFDLYAIFKKN